MQFYCKTKKSGNKYGNYDRYVVFLFEDSLECVWKIILTNCDAHLAKSIFQTHPKAVPEHTAIAIEMTYRMNLEVLTYDT